jgi:DNA-binding NarL/FixJ family response regulator
MKNNRILFVEDHRLLRQAIKIQIEIERPSLVIKEANNGRQALLQLERQAFDLLITDINMPKMDGLQLAEVIKRDYPCIKVLTVSMFVDHSHISKMLEAGVDGYVSKNANNEELIIAIDLILGGERYYSKEVKDILINGMREQKHKKNLLESLSKREMEILHLVLKEYSNKDIADKLFISTRTVETHKYNLLKKTNSKNIAGLFKFAVVNELFPDLI